MGVYQLHVCKTVFTQKKGRRASTILRPFPVGRYRILLDRKTALKSMSFKGGLAFSDTEFIIGRTDRRQSRRFIEAVRFIISSTPPKL